MTDPVLYCVEVFVIKVEDSIFSSQTFHQIAQVNYHVQNIQATRLHIVKFSYRGKSSAVISQTHLQYSGS